MTVLTACDATLIRLTALPSGNWKGLRFLAGLLFLGLSLHAEAATCSWNKPVADPTPLDFTNTANWVGAAVPGVADTTLFTNTLTGRLRVQWSIPVTNAEATIDYIQPASGNHGIFFTNTAWTVTSRFAMMPSAFTHTNSLYIQHGTLNVTNPSHTAVLEVGSGTGLAQFQLLGGTVNLDLLVVTNTGGIVGAGTTAKIEGGTMNIFAGSTILSTNLGSNFSIGNTTNAALNYLGGTNLMRIALGRGVMIGNGSTLRVTGSNTVLDLDKSISVGYGGSGNRVLVENGAMLSLDRVAALVVGSGANAWSNVAATLQGSAGSVLVTDGGILRANMINTGTNGYGTVTISNAMVEFTVAAPTISPKTLGTIVMTNGTVSFLGTTNIDVKGNWNASLTNITFQGATALRLNNSTNRNTASQAYTFGTGGSTNYTRLELLNNALYRGGDVTIGAGGTLAARSGGGTVSSNLIFQSTGACELWIGPTGSSSRVTVGRDVTLGGAALTLRLTAAPQVNYPYVLIANDGPNAVNGQFASTTATAQFDGKTYVFAIRTNGGDGNDVTAVSSTGGTLMIVR